jgi:hypothetical protein
MSNQSPDLAGSLQDAVPLDSSQTKRLSESGYLVLPRLISRKEACLLRSEADRLLTTSLDKGGARNALGKSARLDRFATTGAPFRLATAVLGTPVQATKLTVFDKRPDANWSVPWHQDLTIAVEQRIEVTGFGSWSIKLGVPHVQPPASLLERILAIRVHLDDTPPSNGALRVLPGTHKLGRLSNADVSALRGQVQEETCVVPAGGAMLMSPLLVHASSRTHGEKRRRVLHFEYCAAALPGGLSWPETAGDR